MTLGELLQRLGSSEPAPGGGAAAALVGALGAALVEMTANLTLGRPRFADVEPQARRIQQRAAELRAQLAALADADAEAFDRVSAAYKLPHADATQRATRSQAIQSALVAAANVPLDTARSSARVIELAEAAAPILNPNVISDVLVGAVLANAAIDSAAVNVEINVAAMTDTAVAEGISRELAQARNGAQERTQRTLSAGRSRFPGH
jgi:formiminotetrahydrofolate cyclodeaminase